VVAGLSARLMTEAAARDGYRVIALDAFGDADTRRAALRWQPIGQRGALRLDAERTLAALTAAATEPGVIGWVAGSDFENEAELLENGAAVLPLLGTAPADVRRVRDPAGFFAELGALGLPHPPTQLEAPADPRGWLCKHARSAGGWHIRAAGPAQHAEPPRRPYFQREQAGTPMSALFIGNGRDARLLGCQELIVRALGARLHVYRGAIGPVALPADRQALLEAMLQALSRRFALRGLASLDFIDDGKQLWVLEINPRPSASMGLHDGALMRSHVEACLRGKLPELPPMRHDALRGTEIVFARAPLELTPAHAAALAARGDCHDLPAAGSRFEAGDPVCSVTAQGAQVADVRAALAAKRQALRADWAASAVRSGK
jgi:predicted ATP-grasp superfamily ATP-dependent carboligase